MSEKEREINIEDEDLEQQETQPEEPAEETETTEEQPQEEDPQEQIARLKDQLLRTIAEFENYKKRTYREKQELIFNGGERTITAILPVLDDFERALGDATDDPKAIKDGMELIFKKLVHALEGLGVKKIETDDKDFDVDYHEAVAMVPGVEDEKKGKVVDCIQTGYTLNDKVIRHAKVAVGQ